MKNIIFPRKFSIFHFSLIFRKIHFFKNFPKSVLKCFLEMFENIFLHDEKIFFVQIFFCDQVCTYSSLRNHPEHSQAHQGNSERRQPKSSRFSPLYDILSHPTWRIHCAEMNEFDSQLLQKTSEIFEIGSVEKKLRLLKVGNILEIFENFPTPDRVRYLSDGSHSKCVHPRNLRTMSFFNFVRFFSYGSFDSRHFIFDTHTLYDICHAPK